ncbi:MAG: hypothetical protein FWG93_03510 [Oscillospiraceae bacterium]|nr:hypothetical protein [Oscillospiraceae bacterium]
MKKRTKRIFSLTLCLAMLMAMMLALPAQAAGDDVLDAAELGLPVAEFYVPEAGMTIAAMAECNHDVGWDVVDSYTVLENEAICNYTPGCRLQLWSTYVVIRCINCGAIQSGVKWNMFTRHTRCNNGRE